MQTKLQSKREELGLREKLAQLKNMTSQQTSEMTVAAKLATSAMKQQPK